MLKELYKSVKKEWLLNIQCYNIEIEPLLYNIYKDMFQMY